MSPATPERQRELIGVSTFTGSSPESGVGDALEDEKRVVFDGDHRAVRVGAALGPNPHREMIDVENGPYFWLRRPNHLLVIRQQGNPLPIPRTLPPTRSTSV